MAASAFSATGFLWPFFYHGQSGPLPKIGIFFWVAISLSLILVLAQISDASLDAKSIALLGVLSALIAALRPLGAGAAGIEPMWFILILSARVFGASFGFLLGLLSMLTSAVLTGGFGPWLTYQMFAAAWLGFIAGAFPQKFGKVALRGRSEIALLVVITVLATGIFGILMNLSFWPWVLGAQTQLSYSPSASITENFSRFLLFHFATSMAWDIPRAIFTALLVVLFGAPVLSALRRTKVRAAFLSPIDFVTSKAEVIERAKQQKAT